MSADILTQIVEYKKEEVRLQKKDRSEADLRKDAEISLNRRPFTDKMEAQDSPDIRIIAEIKRASPSKGDICANLDAAKYATAYERAGAAAISILTEQKWFKGSIQDLIDARQSSCLPVLRKDFIISTYQIYESAAACADAVLLIARILTKIQLEEYLRLCKSLKLDALVEIHTIADLEKIQDTNARLVGINNRNLKSFETDIHTAAKLAGLLSLDQIPVAMSGINSRSDIDKMLPAGIRNFLIGESIVRSADPESFIRSLMISSEVVYEK